MTEFGFITVSAPAVDDLASRLHTEAHIGICVSEATPSDRFEFNRTLELRSRSEASFKILALDALVIPS